jgi:hypothetical protein
MMENKEEVYINYKIDTKHKYKIFTSEFNGNRYYKVQIPKTNRDGTKTTFYKQIKFAKCPPVENGEIIKIKKAFEDLYVNSKDPYNPISVVVIMDYEKIKDEKVEEEQAYAEFQQNLKESEYEITDEDLSF